MEVSIALLTRDLRVRDNPVLAAASVGSARTVPLFVLDPAILSGSHGRPNRFGFLCESLVDLDRSLRSLGGSLVVREGNWVDETMRLAQDSTARTIHVARDVSGYAQRRLARLREAARRDRVQVIEHDALGIVPPDVFAKPYQVFTPYYRRWLEVERRRPVSRLRRVALPDGIASRPIPRGAPPAVWRGGESAGLARVKAWSTARVASYDAERERPAVEGTARLSPYLHFGCVSPLEIAERFSHVSGGTPWVRQVCWREFFMQLLWWKPELAHTELRPDAAPEWVDDAKEIQAWKDGRTGYPLVDAGMRQLIAEGWMHNRVRMVTASFLTKDLRVDWRVGAAHFMDLLVDGDVAVNQLSWQWVAGTGSGGNPNRVLSPNLQGRTHDPLAVYVRRWVPEIDTDAYPEPIVDHHEAIAAWQASRRR